MAGQRPIRYVTTNGQPPNGGLVPGQTYWQLEEPQQAPVNTHQVPPRQEVTPETRTVVSRTEVVHNQVEHHMHFAWEYWHYFFGSHPQPPMHHYSPPYTQTYTPPPALAPTPPLSQGSTPHFPAMASPPTPPMDNTVANEPLSMNSDGRTHLFPEDYIVIRFLDLGDRPCDLPGGVLSMGLSFDQIKVPCLITVRELVRRLLQRAQDRAGRVARALQEMPHREGPAGPTFSAGAVLEEEGMTSNWTLRTLGWDVRRNERNPVYVGLVF